MTAELDIIVVLYRSEAFWPTLSRQIESMSGLKHRLIVSDNTLNPRTLSSAWNGLAAEGESRQLCFLNPDVRLSPLWDIRLSEAIRRDPRLGVALPCSFSSERPIRLPPDVMVPFHPEDPPTDDDLLRLSEWSKEDQGIYFFGEFNAPFFCVMMERALFERLGGFDERYRLYGQDHDFQRRMHSLTGQYAGAVRNCVAYHASAGSVREANRNGDVDFAREYSHIAWMNEELTSGRLRPWHELSEGERAAVRNDDTFSRMPRSTTPH